MNSILRISFTSLSILLLALPSAADNICVKKRAAVVNGKVNLGKAITLKTEACSAKEKNIGSSNGTVAGFARIDGSAALVNFGGPGVTSVDVNRPIPGVFQFSFHGDFSAHLSGGDSASNQSKVTAFASTSGGQPYTPITLVITAAEDQVFLVVDVFDTGDNLVDPDEISVAFFLAD